MERVIEFENSVCIGSQGQIMGASEVQFIEGKWMVAEYRELPTVTRIVVSSLNGETT